MTEHFGDLGLTVVSITDKWDHERVTVRQLLNADLVIVTMSFLCGSYYRDQFIGQRFTADIAPLSRYYGYLLTVHKGSAPVLEHIQFRRLVLDEADMYLSKLPYADPELEHEYNRRLSVHCRVNCSRKTEPFIYVQCLQADFRWIMTSTANFASLAQQAAFVSYLGLSLGMSGNNVNNHKMLATATPRTVQPVQPLSLDKALVGPSALEVFLVKQAFMQHLLLARSQQYVFSSMSLPPVDTEVIWVEYSDAERNLVRGALELDGDYNYQRHVHAFPLQFTPGSQPDNLGGPGAMSVQQAGEVMMGAQRRRLLELEASVQQLQTSLAEVEQVRQTSPDILQGLLNHRHQQLTNEAKATEQTMSSIQRSIQFLEASLNSQDPCTICMDAVTSVITRCGHKFCQACLQRSLQERPRCPTCRTPCDWATCIPLLPTAPTPSEVDYGSRFRALIAYLRTVRVAEPEAQFVVFSEWDRELQKQATLLTSEGFRCAQIKGNTATCQHSVLQFQERALDILFLSLQSMASGLHLVTANHVIILTPLGAPFDRADQIERQAIGRCHRVGQTRPVHVRHILVRDSLEEEIWRARVLREAALAGDAAPGVDAPPRVDAAAPPPRVDAAAPPPRAATK